MHFAITDNCYFLSITSRMSKIFASILVDKTDNCYIKSLSTTCLKEIVKSSSLDYESFLEDDKLQSN